MVGMSYVERPHFDEHHQTGRQVRAFASYEYSEPTGEIVITDPVWGHEAIGNWPGDEVFAELFTHPVFQRMMAIEQLTLPEMYATMPDTTGFSRWEHAWGSVVFVRQMIRQAEAEGRTFSDREKLVLQLRTLVSDAAHTAFSHLGDWLRQGFGGSEDSHDEELVSYLETMGVNDTLRNSQFAIQPEEVIFPPVSDWVECSSPALCVDRVDYGVREMMRWVDPAAGYLLRDAFRIDEHNTLVMKDKAHAEYFARGFGLLATEHWSHPVHRLQLQLFGDIVKGAILDTPHTFREYDMHPVDQLYTVDADVMANIRSYGVLNNDLHVLLLDIARAQRRIFAVGRERRIASHIEPYQPGQRPSRHDTYIPGMEEYPHPLTVDHAAVAYSDVVPQKLELIPVNDVTEVSDFDSVSYAVDTFLPAFKARAIDPPFLDEMGVVRRVSEVDARYAAFLETCRAVQSQPYVARIYMAPPAKQRLADKLNVVRREWEWAMGQERTEQSRQNLQASLRAIGATAVGSGFNRVDYVI